jgi:hypothetical protein
LGISLIWFYHRISCGKIMGKTFALDKKYEYNTHKQPYAKQ